MTGETEEKQELEGYAPPRPCAVCEHVCPVAFLADLELAEVCEICKPLVIALVQVRRNGARVGDDAIGRAVKLARELDEYCVAVQDPPAGPQEAR